MKYLLKAVDTYRVPTIADVEALHEQLLDDPTFDLTAFSYKTKYVKQKGDIVDEYQVVTAKKVFDNYTDYLAAGIDSVVNAYDPDAFVLTGGITGQGEKLLAPLKAKLNSKIEIRISKLQGDAGALGATLLGMEA